MRARSLPLKNPTVNARSKSTAGRHIKGEPGFAVRDRRHKHLRQTKKEGEKVFGK